MVEQTTAIDPGAVIALALALLFFSGCAIIALLGL